MSRKAAFWTLMGFCAALPVSIAGLNAALAALTLLLLWADFTSQKIPWSAALTPLSGLLLLYFAAAVAASTAGVSPATSFSMLHKDFHKVWALWIMLVSLRWVGTRDLDKGLALGFSAAAVVGILQTLFLRSSQGDWIRAHAFVHPVTFGQQMTLALLGGLSYLSRAPSPTQRRWIAGFSALVGLAFLLNQTRGALLGLVAGCAIAALLDARLRKFSVAALAALAAVTVVWELLPTQRSLIMTFWHYGLAPIANQQMDRLIFWKVGWEIFNDFPWLGAGPGGYRLLFPDYFPGVVAEQRVWGSAHNLIIHQAAERGIVGLAALAGVLIALLVGALRAARRAPRASTLWAATATFAFIIMNLTEVSFQNEQVSTLALFIWAMAAVDSQEAAKPT